MSVPNQYKGFSKLPEAVQRKMNPELARKYQMGGSVMQRPLFRQMGGAMPAAAPPPMAPPPMAPPPMPPRPDVGQMTAQAEQAGQALGMQAAEQTLAKLDGAQDYETLIDGIRGNEKPIEARYAELATLVGEQDARQTPESVLTLTQPTIMMTEQGALDSGIGELIQSVMGDTEMTGNMRGGVGSLMEAGAGNTPPVNFNQGGPVEVRKFQAGTPVTGNTAQPTELMKITPFLERATSARENILGTPEEQAAQLQRAQDRARSDALFNIARFGLQFAGTTEGDTIAERLANAATSSQVIEGLQKAGADVEARKLLQEQQKQQLSLSALESAERSLAASEKTEADVRLKNIDSANEMKRLLASQSFTATQNQSERDLRTKLANLQIAANKSLQVLRGDQSQEEIAARAAAQIDLADFNNKFRLKLQGDNFNFQERMALTAQEDKLELEDRRNENLLKIEALRFDNSKESAELQQKFAKENLRIRAALDIENSLKKMEAANVYDLAKLEDVQTFDLEKTRLVAELNRIEQEDQQAFTAGQNALQRMLTRGEGAKNRSFQEQQAIFKAELERELTELKLGEDAKERARQQANFLIENAQAEHRLIQGDEQLSLARAKEIFDQQAEVRRLEIEDYKAKAAATDITNDNELLKYIVTNAENYASGTLADPNMFENRVLKYTRKKSSFDPESGLRTSSGNTLSPQIQNLIKEKSPDLYFAITGEEPPRKLPEGQDYFNLPEAKAELFNEQGKVIRDHPSFVNAATTLFKPDVKYNVVIGASRLIPQIRTALVEGIDEIRDKNAVAYAGEEAKNVKQAVSDLDNVSIILNQFLTNGRDDRILQSVQNEINKYLDRIKPGGIFFKSDADAASAFKGLADQVALQMESDRNLLADYGGEEAQFFGAARQEKARLRMINGKPLLNELQKFEEAFRKKSTQVRNPSTDEQVAEDIRNLGANIKKNQGSKDE